MTTGTIALNPTPDAKLGNTITFNWSAEGLHGNQKPRIQVIAYQDTDGDLQVDDVVYGEAGPAGQGFLLGGASSLWLNQYSNQPAHCVATLYYWDFHPQQTFVPLATVEFDAAG